MAALGRVIAEAIVHEYGRDELLRRLAHPFWFQSFGAVMGMDWHSSGITTSVIGALKHGLAPIQHELGFYVCGGKGAHSRRTPHELEEIGSRTGVDAAPLVRASRLPHLRLPHRHEVRASDVMLKRLHGTLAAAAEAGPKDYADLLLMPGVGARTVEAIAFVAEVIHGTPSRFSDPARFSLAIGGKDGHPFPVPITVFDETIRLLKRAVDRAKLGSTEALAAIQRLDAQARMLESRVSGPAFEDFIATERAKSPSFGGRTVNSSRRASREG
jgi:hypothetical protein